MSKAIDDPIIISVPTDYTQEGSIRAAIASSSNDFCSKCFSLSIALRAHTP